MISVDTLPQDLSIIMLDYLKLKDKSNLVSISRLACRMLTSNREWQEFKTVCSLKALYPEIFLALTDSCFSGIECISELCLSYLFPKQDQIQYKRGLAQEIEQVPTDVLDAFGGIKKYVDMPKQRNDRTLAFPKLTSFMGDYAFDYPSIQKGIDSYEKVFFVFRYSSHEGEKMLTVLRQDPGDAWEWTVEGYTSFSINCQSWDLFRNPNQKYLSNAGQCIQNLLSGNHPDFKFDAPDFSRSKESWGDV